MEHSSALEIAPKLEKIRVYPRNLKLSIFFRTKGVEYLITGIHCRTTYRISFQFIFICFKAQLSATNSLTIKSYSSCKKIFVNLSESTVHVGLRNVIPYCGTLPLVALTAIIPLVKIQYLRQSRNDCASTTLPSICDLLAIHKFGRYNLQLEPLDSQFCSQILEEKCIERSPFPSTTAPSIRPTAYYYETRSPEILLISMGYLSRLQIRSISHV